MNNDSGFAILRHGCLLDELLNTPLRSTSVADQTEALMIARK